MSADSLRQKALRSGLHLTVRRIVGVLLGFIGLLYLTRVVGPEAYGIYATVMAVLGYFSTIGSQGGRIYLIRHPEQVAENFFHLVHSYMLRMGCAARRRAAEQFDIRHAVRLYEALYEQLVVPA